MPICDSDVVLERVKDGDISAVAIDTSIFIKYQYHLATGVLARVGIFVESGLDCVVTNVMYMENVKHFSDFIEKAKGTVRQCSDILIDYFEHSESVKSSIDVRACNLFDSNQQAAKLFDAYLDRMKMEILECEEYADFRALMYDYQHGIAPFAVKDKKCEFPDAISLRTLSSWAKDYDKNVLVISDDAGLKTYCDCSERLYYVKSLDDAIRSVACKPGTQYYMNAVVMNFTRLVFDRNSNVFKTILEGLNDKSWKINVSTEIDSYHRFSDDAEVGAVSDFSIITSDGEDAFVVVDSNDDEMVLSCTGVLTLTVNVDISLYAWDGVDREEIPLGTRSFTRHGVKSDAEIYITIRSFSGDSEGDIEVADVDISSADASVEFNNVSPYDGWEE